MKEREREKEREMKEEKDTIEMWDVVVVKWSACLASFRLSEFESRWSPQFFVKFMFEKNKNKQKEAGDGPF